MLAQHIDSLEMSILNLNFEKALECLSLLDIAKENFTAHFKPLTLYSKFLGLRETFFRNFGKERLTKSRLIERVELLYQTGYIDAAEQLFYSGFSLILQKRREYVFNNYNNSTIPEAEMTDKPLLQDQSKRKNPETNPYLVPDENTDTHQKRMGTETMDRDNYASIVDSQFGWTSIESQAADLELHSLEEVSGPKFGILNEQDIKNYFGSIFDLLAEILQLQKTRFDFSRSN